MGMGMHGLGMGYNFQPTQTPGVFVGFPTGSHGLPISVDCL